MWKGAGRGTRSAAQRHLSASRDASSPTCGAPQPLGKPKASPSVPAVRSPMSVQDPIDLSVKQACVRAQIALGTRVDMKFYLVENEEHVW